MTFNISQAVQALGASHVMSNPYGYNEPYGLRPTQATYQAVSRMFAPPTTSRSTVWSGPEPAGPTVVPGPLGIWQPSTSARPYEQIGKFGVNLLGPPPGVAPGAPQVGDVLPMDAAEQLRAAADPSNPQNRGFIEGLLGGIGGVFGEGGAAVGGTIGSIFDTPLEAVGNLAGLPASLLTAQTAGKWSPDIQAAYDAAAKDNPLNALLLVGTAAKTQWSRDVAQGRITGLWSDFGPATNLVEQLGFALNGIFSTPSRLIQRGIAQGATRESIDAIENAIRNGESTYTDENGVVKSTDDAIQNDKWAQIQMRRQRGDFGDDPQEARDKMMDALIVEGALLRAPEDVEQTGFVTWQGMADIALSIATDPLTYTPFILGKSLSLAKVAEMTADTKAWRVVPRELLDEFSDDFVENGLKRDPTMVEAGEVWQRSANGTRETIVNRLEGAPAKGMAKGDFQYGRDVLRDTFNMPKYAQYRDAGLKAVDDLEHWRNTWAPAVRPIVSIVDTINNPFQLFGKTRSALMMGKVFNEQGTEAWIKGQGTLDAHAFLQREAAAVGEDALTTYNEGVGHAAAFGVRVYHKAGFVADLRRRLMGGETAVRNIFGKYRPDEVIDRRLAGQTPGDYVAGIEEQQVMQRPKYVSKGRGNEAAALEVGRIETVQRLQAMGWSPERAQALVAHKGFGRAEMSMIHGAYYGHAMKRFVRARTTALAGRPIKKGIDYRNLTMLSFNTLTEQEGKALLKVLERNDTDAIREAFTRYSLFYENLSGDLKPADLQEAMTRLVEDNIEQGALPVELGATKNLSREMREWVAENEGFGYRAGFRPDDPQKLWNVTYDDNMDVVGINPWIDVVGYANDVPTYNRFQLARDMLFHNVRGSRIMRDASVRLTEYATREWGITESQAGSLFKRFLEGAKLANTTPRGLTPEQVYNIVDTHGLPDDVMKRIGKSQATEALLFAFEGNWRHVGTSQKFTGYAKTALGGQSNWLGVVAEKIYPAVRFTYNPLFQAQELIEPFVLNIMRGVKPGWKPSEWDEDTIRLVEVIIRDSKYAVDDSIERDAMLLLGGDAARNAFGANTRLGRLIRTGTRGGLLDVKNIKRLNYARALRKELGKEFRNALYQFAPDAAVKMPAHFRTNDWGEIAVRYLTEKAGVTTNTDLLKPEHFGARTPINLANIIDAQLFDNIADEDALRAAMRSGGTDFIDESKFKDVLVKAGADPAYAERAYRKVMNDRFTKEEFFDAMVEGTGSRTASRHARAMWRARARVEGLSEEDWLYKRMNGVPMTVDSAALAGMTDAQKASHLFMARAVDIGKGRTATFNKRVTEFRNKYAHVADREHFLILRDDGSEVASGKMPKSWVRNVDGSVTNAQFDGKQIDKLLTQARGHTLIHNHPNSNPFSPHDLATASQFGVKEMIVVAPGYSWMLRPPKGAGWDTPEFVTRFGSPPSVEAVGLKASDDAYEAVRTAMHEDHRKWMDEVLAEAEGVPYYRNGNLLHQTVLEGAAQQHAVEQMAKAYGWTYESIVDHRILGSATEVFNALSDFQTGAPDHLVRANKHAMAAAPLERNDLVAGAPSAQMAAEYTSDHAPWMPTDDALRAANPDAPRQIQDYYEDWFRSEVAPLLGALITDVRRTQGGWLNGNELGKAVNSVLEIFGPNDTGEDLAAAWGFLTKQDSVALSRIKPELDLADAAAGERWAMHFTAPRELDEAGVDAFVKVIAQAAPEVAGWGYKDTLDRSGRTVLRFIRGEQTGAVDRATFDAAAPVNEKVLRKAFGRDEEVLFGSDVVDYRMVSNDWSVNPNGEGYTSFLRERRPDFADELEHGLAEKSTNVLAHAVRQHAPAAFDSHLDAIRAAGGAIPDFRTPGQWKSRPFASRVGVPVPGGRAALLNDPNRIFTLYEQQLLKAAAIDPLLMYEHDPELAVALMKAIWRSKAKELAGTGDLLNQYNSFGWALMTANASLDSTEGAFALWRAVRPDALGMVGPGGIEAHVERTKRLLAGLTEEQRANPSTRATMFQLDEGLRVAAGLDLHRANWLDDAERERIRPIIESIDERLSAVPEGPERTALAKRIQADELDAPVKGKDESLADYRIRRKERLATKPWLNRGKVSLMTHDFGTKTAGEFTSFTTLARPDIRFKGTATNISWGRLMGWLDSGLFSSDNANVQAFMRQQAGESRHAYALRLSSILPGIDVKTGMMAVQTAGPGQAAHGALDTHILRYILQRADDRGEAENLLSQLSKGYREHLQERLPSTGSGKIDNFVSPTAIQRYLVPDSMRSEPWSEAKRMAMEARLDLIDDPVTRDLYRDPEVLRFVSETGGKINKWEGSDYQILSDYFNTVLRMEEVDALRAKGFDSVADQVAAMNGGEWQWFKWDHIRAASAGQTMDPHVSVTNGVEMMTPRTSMELDRNIVISRNKTPYDPINSMVFQEMDGQIMGAVQFDDMDRATLMLTEHADASTIVHELGHIFEKDLDDSMRQQIMREFRKATGTRQRQWGRNVSEWWADSFMDYARSRGHRGDENLRSSFAYFRKAMTSAEEALHTGKEREVLTAQKAASIARAEKAVAKHSQPLSAIKDEVREATRDYNRAARGLKSARARAQLPALEGKHNLAKSVAETLDQNLRDAKSRVRALGSEQRAAELRAQQALGTSAAGGARRAANRKAQQIAEAEALVKKMTDDLGKARDTAGDLGRKVTGARKRISVGEWESRSASSKEVLDAALRRQRGLEKNLTDAQGSLQKAKDLKVKPKGVKVPEPVMSDDLRTIWDDLMKEPDRPNLMAGDGQPFDMQEEAVYQAALSALSRAEENAFTLHYYKRGRTLVERSINHPYFGLYPASYMWGKILPELTRFLLKKPFGLDAPLGGLALAHNLYRQVLMRQQYDREFRDEMASNTDFWHFVALMTPALPWEIPVNAPLWMRRISSGGLEHQDKLEEFRLAQAEGRLTPSQFDPVTGLPLPPETKDLGEIASVGQEMLGYAFGPANAVENVAAAVGAAVTPVDAAIRSVEDLLRDGQDASVQAAQGVDPVGLPAMIPPQQPSPTGQGY